MCKVTGYDVCVSGCNVWCGVAGCAVWCGVVGFCMR